MEELSFNVQEPDGTIRRVKTIASDWDDIGNRIAEGLLTEAERFPVLLERANARRAHSERRRAAAEDAIRRAYYDLATVLNYLAKV